MPLMMAASPALPAASAAIELVTCTVTLTSAVGVDSHWPVEPLDTVQA